MRLPLAGVEGVEPVNIGPLGIELHKPWMAPLDVLRRRTYLRVIALPRGRYLIVGWLPL